MMLLFLWVKPPFCWVESQFLWVFNSKAQNRWGSWMKLDMWAIMEEASSKQDPGNAALASSLASSGNLTSLQKSPMIYGLNPHCS